MAAEREAWDYVIVGGGSAGCVLANRLSADPACRVLLLDAGVSDRHPYSRVPAAVGLAIMNRRMNWSHVAEADPSRCGRTDMWPAGKLLGGGSSINGMMFVRGNAWDYNRWAALGATGWAYRDVLPYFRSLENNERGADEYRGTDGPQNVADERVHHPLTNSFIDAMRELGVPRNPDLNGASQDGVDVCQVTQRKGLRHSAAAAFLEPVRSRANLEVRLRCCVDRVAFTGRRADAVYYRRDGEARVVAARRGVVLSAGALGSPKILLLSGVGPQQALRANEIDVVRDVPGVGRNLQEHPGIIVSALVTVPTVTSDTGPFAILREGWRFLTRRQGALTLPVGHAHAFVRTREDLPAPNIQIIFSPTAFDHHETGVTVFPQPAVTFAVGLCRVASRGEVRLRSADPDDAPVIDYSLLGVDDDLQQLAEGVRFARRLYSTRAFGPYFKAERAPGDPREADDRLREHVRQHAFLMYHPCGTCRMGVDSDAVVAPDLCVHGVDGLWVADASVMPTIPAGNINATCLMIGEKAAHHIRTAATGRAQ